MMKNLLSLTAILSIFLQSCISGHVSSRRLNQGAFPPEFNNPNHILLIQKRTTGINHKGMNKYLNKYFRKHYSGKYEMASKEEIMNSPKYQDRKIYRFVLSDDVWTSRSTITKMTSTGADIQYNNVYRIGYHLFDLLEDKNYPEMGVSSNVPAKAMKRAAMVLNKRLHM